MEMYIVKTLIRRERHDLGLHCFHKPIILYKPINFWNDRNNRQTYMFLSVISFLKDTRKINFQFLSSIVVTLVFQVYCNDPKFSDRSMWANSADPDQTAPTEAV